MTGGNPHHRLRESIGWAGGLCALALAVALAAAPLKAQRGDAAQRCRTLAGLELEGVEIVGAKLVPAAPAGTVRFNAFTENTFDAAFPEYCRVDGVINRRVGSGGVEYGIGFALNLPTTWEGRLLFQGGGAFNGAVRDPYGPNPDPKDPALARGFAVVSTDSGHNGAPFDVTFMADQQAGLDFAYQAVGRVIVAAKTLAAAYFGQAPHHTYGVGCSTGGREGMIAAQRFPDLIDGIVSGDPAMRTAHTRIAGFWATTAFNRIAPRDAEGKPLSLQAFPPADQKLLHDAVARKCDRLDGLADGMVFNIRACKFDPGELQCAQGKETTCLSAEQVGALRTAFGGPTDKYGKPIYVGFPYDLGLLGESVANKAMSMLPVSGGSPYGSPPNPFWYDVDSELARIASNGIQILSDTDQWVDLGTFYRRGGKIMFYNGAADPWFSMYDTLGYFERNRAANPEFDSSRFYSIPGMAHCGEGPLERFDMLTPLVEWVENGAAPREIVAWDWMGRGPSRPLCPWPQYARYRGAGDPRLAASFECAAE